jgi:hypothetical protein
VVLVNEPARSIGSNNRMLLYHFGSLEELLAAAVDLPDRYAGFLGDVRDRWATVLAGALRAWPEVNRPVHF